MAEAILITGGAGFAGSSVAIALKHSLPDVSVTVLDNLRRRGSALNLPRLRDAGVGFIHGDVRSLDDLLSVKPSPDLIIEASAEPSAQAGYHGSPDYLVSSNLVGCYHCLELARRTRADFIFLSTSRVYPYGRLNSLPFVERATRYELAEPQTVRGVSAEGIGEDFPLEGARSIYGMTKLAAELMVEEYGDAYGIRFIIDRFGLLTGPWQMAKSDQGVLALWMAAHYFRRPLAYLGFEGSGKQVRDFLHVDDFCWLIVDQVRNFPRYSGRRFNAGGGVARSLSLLEATGLCREITGNSIDISASSESRSADVRIYLSDARVVSAVNGWAPQHDARRTLGDIFAWLRAEERNLRDILLQTFVIQRSGPD
jgi:CDP-paratose 2-epimerase